MEEAHGFYINLGPEIVARRKSFCEKDCDEDRKSRSRRTRV
jgi:hypothetical protein